MLMTFKSLFPDMISLLNFCYVHGSGTAPSGGITDITNSGDLKQIIFTPLILLSLISTQLHKVESWESSSDLLFLYYIICHKALTFFPKHIFFFKF